MDTTRTATGRIVRAPKGWRVEFRYDPRAVEAIKGISGRRFDPATKTWMVPCGIEAHLGAFAARFGLEVPPDLAAAGEVAEATKIASRATDASIEIPAPEGLAYLPFQRAGIAFALARPSCLIADAMGLGKTIEALGVINADTSIRQVLVVCPASLKLNWLREAERWLVRPLRVHIANAKHWPTDADMLIVNYDILHVHAARIVATEWDLLIADEVHLVKNPKARRSKAFYAIRARRKLPLTGTPILNRPIELFPIINFLDPAGWPSFFPFAQRYADAHQGAFGWDFSGASHLDELQDRLRSTIMVRRLKSEVLTELPAKRRQIIEITANGAAGVVARERQAWTAQEDRTNALRDAVELAKATDDPAEYERAVSALQAGTRAAFAELARLRHETALAKVPKIIEHIAGALDGGTEKLVVFGHHHDVIAQLAEATSEYGAVVLTGETPLPARQAAVDRFQTDPSCRIFIGSITAAGVGLTLTAASHVLFAELDWVPANLSQAEDRCHRIGQRASVLVQHLVLDGSLDATMARRIVAKQEIIDRALDTITAQMPMLPTDEPASGSARREQIAKEAETLTDEQVAAIHRGLQMLTGVCDGAYTLDGAGFSKVDVRIGHALAETANLSRKQAALGRRFIKKYHRQLPAEILSAAGQTDQP